MSKLNFLLTNSWGYILGLNKNNIFGESLTYIYTIHAAKHFFCETPKQLHRLLSRNDQCVHPTKLSLVVCIALPLLQLISGDRVRIMSWCIRNNILREAPLLPRATGRGRREEAAEEAGPSPTALPL